MTQEELYHLIGKKLADDISTEESSRLQAAIDKNPEYQALYTDLENKWLAASKLVPSFDSKPEDSWEKFESSLNKKVPIYRSLPFFYRVAAMMVLGLGLGYFIYNSDTSQAPAITYTTGTNETQEITLADNSVVWLNAESKLIVEGDFGMEERNVSLTGEAFFDVERDETSPFIITNPETRVQVLGTSFNVRAYPDEDEVKVNVSSGSVALSDKEDDSNLIILEKGTGGVFNKETHNLLAHVNQSANFLSWQVKKLVFDDAILSSVIGDLEEYFKVQISIGNAALAECRFTGTFNDPKLEEILEVLQITMNITVKKSNTGYELDGPGCSK